jgi:flagellar motility protein MotE (MotC chaperone)
MRNSCSNNTACDTCVWIKVIFAIFLIGANSAALAEEAISQPTEDKKSQNSEPAHQASLAHSSDKISPEIAELYEKYGAYCDAIVDEAREQRYALKRAEIETLATQLQKQIEVAETQSAALEKWVRRREEFAKQATSKIVEIYANMRPEASASRLQQLDINLAASLLLAIPPRQASPILNEMDEKNAAAITAVMAASARAEDPS